MATYSREQVAYENWGWMAARGVITLLLGLTVLVWPATSLVAMVILIGTILLVDGVTALIYSASGGRTRQGTAWPLVLAGLAGVGAAVVTYVWPQITVGVLMMVVALWAILRGVLEIVAYVALRDRVHSSWLLAVSGALALVFGIVLLVWPALGLRVLTWIIGVYSILAGAVFVGLALRMRHALDAAKRDPEYVPPEQPGEPISA